METPVLESLFNNAADLQVCDFIKKRLQHRCFPVIIAKFFKNTYFEEHLQTAASVYSKDLLKYKNCVVKICFQRVFEFIKAV